MRSFVCANSGLGQSSHIGARVAAVNAIGSTRVPRSGKCSFVCYEPGESNNSCRSEGPLVRSLRNYGISADSRRFRRARDRFRFCARDDYPVVQFMPANDCNLRSIRLAKHFSLLLFSSTSTFDPPRPPLFPSPSASGSTSSGSLACRKVQNTQGKRAIRDRTPLTFHFSWSKIIRSPSYVPRARVRSFR